MFKSDYWKYLQSFVSFFQQLLIAHWRSLLLLLLGVYLPLLVFEELVRALKQHESGLSWDVSILLAIHQAAQPQLDILAARLTPLGVFWGVFPVATVIGLVLLKRRQWRSLSYWIITLLGSTIINRTVKEFLHRVRPHLWESFYPPALDYAFPSGHAMSSMTVVVALLILTWGSRWCWSVLILGGLFVLAIGWTRLYLGVHYPSDVLAGWTISLAWAIGVSLLLRPNLPETIIVDDEKS